MGMYLVVADRGAWSQGFVTGLTPIAKRDPEARFVLVVPVAVLPSVSDEVARQAATESAARARTSLRLAGLHVAEALAGDAVPKKAIEDEIERGFYKYDAIIIGARSRGVAPGRPQDLAAELERHHGIPVTVIEPRMALMG